MPKNQTPANAFNEGMDIDILIPLVSLGLQVANLRAVREATQHQEAHGRLAWAS
jgi:hypothetical protein